MFSMDGEDEESEGEGETNPKEDDAVQEGEQVIEKEEEVVAEKEEEVVVEKEEEEAVEGDAQGEKKTVAEGGDDGKYFSIIRK